MALTEPGGGSDLRAMTTIARKDADGCVAYGAKTWITDSRRSRLVERPDEIQRDVIVRQLVQRGGIDPR